MDNVVAYILLTTGLALLQVRENYIAYLAKHRADSISFSFTLIEFCWVFVSLSFLILSDISKLEASIPVIYIAINACGWVAGHFLYKRAGAKPMDLSVIPDSFYFAAMFVCAALFFYGVYVLFNIVPFRRNTPITEFLFSNASIIVWVPISFIILRELIVTFARDTLKNIESQILDAVPHNDTCNTYFGRVITATLNDELTEENTDEFVYAYFVVGSENSGTLIAHFTNINRTKYRILFGIIITESGEEIELNEISLHA